MRSTLHHIKTIFSTELNGIYPDTEINSFFRITAEEILGLTPVEIHLNMSAEIDENKFAQINKIVDDLKHEKPIQYIIGHTEFYELKFLVNENVLIPRPETEELVHWIITDNRIDEPVIIDIGTGSGCIPVSLAKNINSADVKSIDISEDAIETATRNAKLNNVNVEFVNADILSYTNIDVAKADIVVSNPPYIRESEKRLMSNNVLDNEPHLALFVDDNDPLIFYKVIADFAISNLKKGGVLYLEINEAFGEETCNMLIEKGFTDCILRKDLFGKDRMIKAMKP
ncbi:MAG: peptide chain release factor N(5)-glutamine methyltransferase [Bacteroidales bacterium]|jgi:release factor glutamine methyltransferase|nr:peptide chain release factor N(5)-glutamine methyltransferase [Bacteroidales bacterium]